ncbi:MAG: ABC transporter ATP-binding protein [Candidatus Bathyarchaeia archaeon]
MSVAKPTLEYVKSINIVPDFSRAAKALRLILGYQKPYVPLLLCIVALSVVRSYMFSLEPLYTSQIIDQVVIGGRYDLLQGLVMNIVFSVMGYALTNFCITFLNGLSAQLTIRDIRNRYYAKLQEKSFRFFDFSSVGDLLSRATMDLQPVEGFLRTWLGVICDSIFTVVAVIRVMYNTNPSMTLLALLPIPLIFYMQVSLFTKTMPKFRKMQMILGRLSAYIQQNIVGMKNVRIFMREEELEKGFKDVEEVYVDTAIAAGKIQSRYTPAPEAILNLSIAFIYVYAGTLLTSPSTTLTIGMVTLFSRYMMRLTMPMRNLSQLTGSFINSSAGFERLLDMMEAPPDVADLPDARDMKIERGDVTFENVAFEYAKGIPVLKNISFRVKAGKRVAILGATGSGKTTMIYLIPRFYDATSGRVLIDGIDVRNYTLRSLRKQIGLVLQDVFLFSGTIKDNIAFGKPDASMEEIITAAKIAQIHDFIQSLPEGYNTYVGERGVTLSGGQRQRITIARALLTDPRIIILDDSLSFVDAKTEQEIQKAIEEATKGRTTFVIAQRLSTIKNADQIIVLDNGEIAEFGSHDELMAKNGIYRRIYETQFLDKAPEEIMQAEAR